jgi:hypothetical protein
MLFAAKREVVERTCGEVALRAVHVVVKNERMKRFGDPCFVVARMCESEDDFVGRVLCENVAMRVMLAGDIVCFDSRRVLGGRRVMRDALTEVPCLGCPFVYIVHASREKKLQSIPRVCSEELLVDPT